MHQQSIKRILALTVWGLLAACTLVYAGSLESLMETYLVTKDKAGQEVFTKTDSALPGDVVEYRTTYRNGGDSPLSGLVVQVPVPASTQYLPGSAHCGLPHDLMVSIDGGVTWDKEPVMRIRKDGDGVEKQVIVGSKEYSHIRWIPKQPIQPGEVQVYRCRVKIS